MGTPGPWIVDESCGNEVRQPKGSNRRRIKLPPDHDGIEDARLVAAAPDLLAALYYIRLNELISDRGVDIVEAAIKKAREDAWSPRK